MFASSSSRPSPRPSSSHFLVLAATFALAAIVVTTGCGSGGMSTKTPPLSGNTSVTVMMQSSANDQFSEFDLVPETLTLTNQAGKTATLFSLSQGYEFMHLNGQAEPLITVTVPQDVYTSATATVGAAQFTCLTLLSDGGLDSSTYAYGYTPNSQVTVNLPSPITVTGDTMALSLNLLEDQSASFASCYPNGNDPYSITPTFNLTPSTIASQPTNSSNGKALGIDGQIAAVAAGGNSFTLSVSEGDALTRSVTINTGNNTQYEGVANLAALTAGTFVDMDAATQTDGSLLATRIAVEDSSATNVVIGPLMFVDEYEPALTIWGRDQQGSDFVNTHIIGGQYFSFDSAVFQISGQLTNLQNLPFVASFNGSNMVAGQNVYLSAPHLTYTSNPYTELRTITLMPQAIDGQVFGVTASGNFQIYDVELASYDLFPALAVQQGQATLLTNPSQVEVYVDSSTQMLNTDPLTLNNTLRFYGLVFNDNGTLRMDCAQVNDGVPFPQATSPAQMQVGQPSVAAHTGPGGSRQTNTVVRTVVRQ